MKVLLINGSSRANGCTFTALSEVQAQLEKEGIATELVQIGTKPIRGCIACQSCRGKGKCVFNDDLANEVREKLNAADGLVVGSPVYYASANGSLISLLDRVFYPGGQFAHKPAAAVVSARRAGTTATLDEIYKYFAINQMPIVSSVYWPMVHGNTPEQVREDLEGMQVMRTLARNMAWLLKSIEAGKQAGIGIPEAEPRIFTNFIR